MSANQNHTVCRVLSGIVVFQPERLIDVGLSDSSAIRLQSRAANDKEVSYVALSCCWGEGRSQPGRTTRANLSKRFAFFDLATQPKTIQDAVEVTRRLGVRYIWIDSLCIVQDDDSDEAIQVGEMHKIYASAILTISAARASDSEQGFLATPYPSAPQIRIRYLTPKQGVGSVILSKDDVQSEPLHQRAWTLQEHTLSRRLLIYGTNRLRWSCRTSNFSNGPEVAGSNLYSMAEDLGRKFPSEADIAKLPFGEDFISWQVIVEDFTSRELTQFEDRLPVLAGIAARYSRVVNSGRYLAGLWAGNLEKDLLWRRGEAEARMPEPNRHTTWSLATMNARINWDDSPGHSEAGLLYTRPSIVLVDADVEPTNVADPFSSTKPALLRLRGHLVSVPAVSRSVFHHPTTQDGHPPIVPSMQAGSHLSPISKETPHAPENTALFQEDKAGLGDDTPSATAYLDYNFNPEDLSNCYCLETITLTPLVWGGGGGVMGPPFSWGLLLRLRDEEKHVFTRLGTYRAFEGDDGHYPYGELGTKENVPDKLPHCGRLFEDAPVVDCTIA